MRSGWGVPAAFALLVLVAAGVLCWELDEPWIGKHEGWNGAVYSLAARGTLTYGYSTTRLGVLTNGDAAGPSGFVYYTNHPPLLPLTLSVAYALLGEHEWAGRLVAVAASLASLVVLCLIGLELSGPFLALAGGFLFALMPMNAFYGRMVDHEAPTNLLALLAALLYLRWSRSRRGALLAGSIVTLALGMAMGWPAYYLAGILPAHHLWRAGRGRRDARVLAYPAVALAAFGLFLAHVWWLQGGAGLGELARMFVVRTSAGTSDYSEGAAEAFTWAGFLATWLRRSVRLFTLPVLVAAGFEVVQTVRERGSERLPGRLFALTLLLFGLTHVFFFRQGAWVHEYWGFYLAAPLALLAAGGLSSLTRGRPNAWVTLVFAALFLVSALPRIRALHGADDANVLGQCRVVAAHTRPGDLVCTNEGFLKPQISFYARRDVHEGPVRTVAALEEILRLRRPRPLAFLLLEGGPGEAPLQAWLATRAPAERVVEGRRTYLVFRVPGTAAGSGTADTPPGIQGSPGRPGATPHREGVMGIHPTEIATFAGGCFWCLEAVFGQLQGVERVESGYSGGHVAHPTYEQVGADTTGHAEVVQITFGPKVVPYRDLLEIFFAFHDPTTPNRQGPDAGTQYRSAIFTHSPAQKAAAEQIISALTKARTFDRPIVTEVRPFTVFYRAEDYHQGYYAAHPDQAYCRVVISPKIAKLRAKYAARLKATR